MALPETVTRASFVRAMRRFVVRTDAPTVDRVFARFNVNYFLAESVHLHFQRRQNGRHYRAQIRAEHMRVEHADGSKCEDGCGSDYGCP